MITDITAVTAGLSGECKDGPWRESGITGAAENAFTE
jgi:hypothetical protein